MTHEKLVNRSLYVQYLDTNTTTNAELFRDDCNLIIWGDFNAKFAHPYDRATFFAFLPASLWLALVRIDNGNSSQLLRFLGGFKVTRHTEAKRR